MNFNTKEQNIYQQFVTSNKAALSGVRPPTTESEFKDIEIKSSRLRSIIIGAGIRGIVALLRQFKYFEQQNGGALDLTSFENALIDF